MKHIPIIGFFASLTPLALPAAQMSDRFDDRPQTGGYSEALSADTSFATLDSGETAKMHGSALGRTAWAEWIAPENGFVTVDTIGTAFQTPVLAIYTGDSFANLKTVARVKSGVQSTSFPVTAGTAYQIVLDSGSGSIRGSGLGQVNINLVPEAIPATATGTDRFMDRPRLAGLDAFGVANNTAATRDPFQPKNTGASGRDVWWQWTASATGRVTIKTEESGFDTMLTVFSGDPQNDPPFGELEMVAQNDNIPNWETSEVSFQTQAGRVYQIAVSSANTSYSRTGNVILELNLVPNLLPPAIPGSDTFERRPALIGNAAVGVACNRHHTRDANEVLPTGDYGRSVWWSWQAPESGRYDIDTRGSEANTILRVYAGENLATLQQVSFNDDVPGASWSKLQLTATRGAVYQIRVDHPGSSSRHAGNIVLNLNRVPAPEIDVQQPLRSSLVSSRTKRSFGTILVGRVGAPKEFTIRNIGNAPLSGVVVRIVGHTRDFVIQPPARASVAPGAALTFKVVFKPTAPGNRNAWIQVFSNDSDENPFIIPLSGLAVKR